MSKTQIIFIVLTLFSIINIIQAKIRVVSPSKLRDSITESEKNEVFQKNGVSETKIEKSSGEIKYSVSAFGKVNYTEKSLYEIYLADNETGCMPLKTVIRQKSNMKVAFLLKRSKCSYKTKLNNLRLAGGDLAIEYDDRIGVDPKSIESNGEKGYSWDEMPMIFIENKVGI